MKKLLLTLLFTLGLAAGASAQTTHPCDLPAQTVATKGTVLGWCHDLKDGTGTLFSSLGFIVNINGTDTDLGYKLPLTGASSTGLYYFEAPLPTNAARGTYPIYLRAYVTLAAADISLPSTTIQWQVGGPPSAPKNPRTK